MLKEEGNLKVCVSGKICYKNRLRTSVCSEPLLRQTDINMTVQTYISVMNYSSYNTERLNSAETLILTGVAELKTSCMSTNVGYAAFLEKATF